MTLDHVDTLENLETEAIAIEQLLSYTISEQPADAFDRGSTLAVYIARTGKMMCDAKYHQDEARNKAIQAISGGDTLLRLPASTLNKYVDSCIQDENYMVNWCERLHRTCEKQWEWCRTIISYAKEEKKLGGYQK